MVEGKGRLTAGGREIEGSEPAPTSQSEGIAEEIFTRVLYTATNLTFDNINKKVHLTRHMH